MQDCVYPHTTAECWDCSSHKSLSVSGMSSSLGYPCILLWHQHQLDWKVTHLLSPKKRCECLLNAVNATLTPTGWPQRPRRVLWKRERWKMKAWFSAQRIAHVARSSSSVTQTGVRDGLTRSEGRGKVTEVEGMRERRREVIFGYEIQLFYLCVCVWLSVYV